MTAPLQGARPIYHHEKSPEVLASYAAADWTPTGPERQSVPIDDGFAHLHPNGTPAPAGFRLAIDAGRLLIDVDDEDRARFLTVSCPCWPSVTAWRDGHVIGRTVRHHRMDDREETP